MSLLREILKNKSNRKTYTDRLLEIVDDYEIYSSLIGIDLNIGETISSPIRSSDDFPSFAIFVPTKTKSKIRPDEIWFKDLADGDFGDVFEFTRLFAKFNYNLVLDSRKSIIKFIDSQLSLGLFTDSVRQTISLDQREDRRKILRDSKKSSELFYKSRSFTKRDLEYWGKLDIGIEDLKFWNIKSIKHLLDKNGLIKKTFRLNELCFVYNIWDKDKLYQPEAHKSFKFRNTCPGDDYRYYQGFEQLSGKADILIITKSYKDLIVMHKFFNIFIGLKVDVLAPHAESINLSEEFVEGVKSKYKTIVCVSDFDRAGVKFAQQCKRYGFHYKFVSTKRIKINGKYKVMDKDVSDFRMNHDKEQTIKLLKSWNLDLI
jgi:hypothetical protein